MYTPVKNRTKISDGSLVNPGADSVKIFKLMVRFEVLLNLVEQPCGELRGIWVEGYGGCKLWERRLISYGWDSHKHSQTDKLPSNILSSIPR